MCSCPWVKVCRGKALSELSLTRKAVPIHRTGYVQLTTYTLPAWFKRPTNTTTITLRHTSYEVFSTSKRTYSDEKRFLNENLGFQTENASTHSQCIKTELSLIYTGSHTHPYQQLSIDFHITSK